MRSSTCMVGSNLFAISSSNVQLQRGCSKSSDGADARASATSGGSGGGGTGGQAGAAASQLSEMNGLILSDVIHGNTACMRDAWFSCPAVP